MYAIGAIAIALAAIIWSADGFLRQSLYAAPSMLVVMLEHLFGALLYSPVLLLKWKDVRSLNRKAWGVLLWVCLISGMLALFLYTKALSYVGYLPLSVVVLLQKLQPFFAIACASLVLRERITLKFLGLAVLASIGGYLVTFGLAAPIWSADNKTLLAGLMAVGAAACWGTSTVFSKYLLTQGNSTVITALRLLITTLIAGAFVLALGQYSAIDALTFEQWRALVIIVCTAGGVALGIYYFGLKRVPASHATIYELMWPLSAIILDYLFRGVLLTLPQIAGGIILILAMLLLPRSPHASPA